MNHGYSMLGFIVIVILYVSIGLMAAAGAISMARKVLVPQAEQIVYTIFLILIALFYLAFTAYFGVAHRMAAGIGCRRWVFCASSGGYAAAFRSHCGLSPAQH